MARVSQVIGRKSEFQDTRHLDGFSHYENIDSCAVGVNLISQTQNEDLSVPGHMLDASFMRTGQIDML